MTDINSQSSGPIQASLDGKHHWNQRRGVLKTQTNAIAVTPTSEGGEASDLQDAIDFLERLGGGTVFLRNGTYTPTSEILLTSSITIQGESTDSTIIDFNNAAIGLVATGQNTYTTGTVAVSNNSTTVTGSGTTWTSAMIGRSIIISGIWFVITNVSSTTSLTIEAPFDSPTVSGVNYVIAEPITGVTLRNFTVQNSTDSEGAVLFRYLQDGDIEDVVVYDSTIGFNFVDTSSVTAEGFFTVGCGTGVNVNHAGVWTFTDFACYSSTGDNMVLNRMFSASISNATISSAGDEGILVTESSNLGIYDMTITTNAGNGIQISNSSFIQISSMLINNNGGDGIELTLNADRVGMHLLGLQNNGAFGIQIVESNSADNTITSCFFLNNTSGTISDTGTTTIQANNQT